MTSFIHTQKQKQLLMKVTLIMYLNQSILQLYQIYKNFSGWIIDSVIDHNIDISKDNPLVGSIYISFSKQWDHLRKGLVDIQDIYDNEFFKWCLVGYLHPADCDQARIAKADKDFSERLDFKDTKLPAKVDNTHIIEKNNSIGISVSGYENKEKKHPIYVSIKFYEAKLPDLLLIGEEGNRHCSCKRFEYIYI